MDIRSLVRDGDKVKAALHELPDGKLIVKKQIKIHIPTRFQERDLAEVGVDNYTVGLCALILEDQYYGVLSVNAMLRITPTSTLRIKIDGTVYIEFVFNPGDTLTPSTQLVKTDTLVFRIYDEIISKGNVPWYLGYNDLGRIFDTARYHAGANIGTNSEVTELIMSLISRNKKDRTKYYRTVINKLEDLETTPPAFIPLRSVIFGATNTTNKLAGNYFDIGLKSALVSPAERTERIEELLRR